MRSLGFERYSRLWSVYVHNAGEDYGFETTVWRDTQAGAERTVRAMYPNALEVYAEDIGWDYEGYADGGSL